MEESKNACGDSKVVGWDLNDYVADGDKLER
jgi:hypothetical protein